MQPRILKTDVAEYIPGQFDLDQGNQSGITPIGDKILVLTDQVAEQTHGGISIPEEQRERQALAAETGVIVAIGGAAFFWNSDRTRPWDGEKPEVGDHVCIARYAGVVFTGDDGQKYRVMDDTCVAAVRKAPLQAGAQA